MNPLNLLDLKVDIKVKEYSFDGIAYVRGNNSNGYEISISTIILDKYKEFKSVLRTALLLHEMSHVKYGSFNHNKKVGYQTVWNSVDNILEDARIEYNLMLDYPASIDYLEVALKLVKNIAQVEQSEKEVQTNKNLDKDLEAFNNEMKMLYGYVRFDEEPEDKELLEFLAPLVLSSKRGNRLNSTRVTDCVYRYLTYNLNSKASSIDKIVEKSEEEVNIGILSESNAKDGKEGKAIRIKINKDKVKDLLKDIKDNEDKAKNKGKKGGGHDNKEEYKDDAIFHKMTIKKHHKLIQDIEKVFREELNKYIQVKVKEGEMSFNSNDMQQMYINSFTGDEGKTFIRNKILESEFDAIIFRDVSYSTNDFKVDYAESTIVFLEALSRFKFVNTAVIDFGSSINVRKDFSDNKPNIVPWSCGGTNLSGALATADCSIRWKSKKRIAIIITDGEPNSINCVKHQLSLNYYKNVKIIPIIIRSYSQILPNQIHINEVKELPIKLMNELKGGK